MQIESIASKLMQTGNTSSTAKSTTQADFSNILSDAIQNAIDTDQTNQVNTANLLTNTDTELHTALIESQKAELSLNLAIQIRNKVVEAYNEIMRMQV